MKRYIFLLVAILYYLQSCLPSSCYKEYSFEFPVTVSPRDTFSIGDTIWYEMNLPNQILDRNSGEYIDFTDFELFFYFNTSLVDSTIYPQTTIQNFEIVTKIGEVKQYTNPYISTYIHCKSIREKYFHFGIIPKMSGTFSSGLSISPIAFLEESEEGLTLAYPNCTETMARESGVKINNGDVNYYLVNGICQYSSYDSTRICYDPYERFSNIGGYAFHVKP